MSMHNLIEYSDNYSKTSGILGNIDEPALNNVGIIIDFPDANNSGSFKFKQKITGQTGNDGTKDVHIMVSLKHLSNFWRTIEMLLINCEINLFLNCLENCFIMAGAIDGQVPKFVINYTKLYVPVVALSTNDNAKLLQQLRTGFKRAIN